MKYKTVRGMEDILPDGSAAWQALECTSRKLLKSFGYSEIRTPILEDTAIFVRSIGEDSDIVKKEMYTLTDRKGRSLTMRPEGTAPIVRAFIEHSLGKTSPETKLFYIGPMFRSERPQKGRTRQFHQIGAELMGSSSPYADAEIIMQMDNLLKELGLKDFTIKLNSLGCKKDKEKFTNGLKKYLEDKESRLCDDCKVRIKKNPLRVLDCKKDTCIQVLSQAPNITEDLCEACNAHYQKIKSVLSGIGINYKETPKLVRGLDYYTGTVFEVTHPLLGGQDAMGAGGRYDNLIKDLGGQSIGATGYALGIERIMIALGGKVSIKEKKDTVYIATLGDDPKIEGIKIANNLREKGLNVLTDTRDSSLKAQMRNADKNNARFAIILGEDELKKGSLVLRDMSTKAQEAIKIESVYDELEKKVGK